MTQAGQDFPDCSRCRQKGKGAYREKWGCDRPTNRVASWWMGCDCGSSKDCPRCKGKGSIPMKRCPSSILEACKPQEAQALSMAMQLYAQYDARQTLPAQGGWLDQAPSFLALVSLVDGERGRWDRLREEALTKASKKGNRDG